MLLHNDVVTDGEPKPSSFSGRLRCEERVEHLLLHLGWNAGAVVADRDFHLIAKTARRGRKGWLVALAASLGSPLCCRIKAVRDQIEKHPREILRKHVGLPSSRVE